MNEPGLLDCATAREQVSAGCDDEAESTAALALHLDGCTGCREFAARCGELARAFDPLRVAEPPADLERRLLARASDDASAGMPAEAQVMGHGGAGWRAAAGLVGLLGVGAIGAWAESRRGGAATEVGASWIEPLSGRALHPGDASLRTWSEAMSKVVGEERR